MDNIIFLRDKLEKFNCFHFNARSLASEVKMAQFSKLFSCSNVSFKAVTETCLKKSRDSSAKVRLDKFNLFRRDRHRRIGGGVAIYVRNYLSTKDLIQSKDDDEVEYVFVKIKVGGIDILVGVVYIPNRSIDYSPRIHELSRLSPCFNNIIIAGDFNINLLNLPSNVTSEFVDEMSSLDLAAIHNNRPTYNCPNSSAFLLDYFFASDINRVLFKNRFISSGFSEHDMIYISYEVSVLSDRSKSVCYRDYANVQFEGLIRKLYSLLES